MPETVGDCFSELYCGIGAIWAMIFADSQWLALQINIIFLVRKAAS